MKLLKTVIASALLVLSTSALAELRPAMYYAECTTPKGVFAQNIYDYSVTGYMNNITITPLEGNKIVFINPQCMFVKL